MSQFSALQRCDSQKQLQADTYGPNLSDVERQIAEHNILHQEIEAYSDQLKPSTTTSQVKTSHTHTLQDCMQDESLTFFFSVSVHRSSTPPSKRNMLNFV